MTTAPDRVSPTSSRGQESALFSSTRPEPAKRAPGLLEDPADRLLAVLRAADQSRPHLRRVAEGAHIEGHRPLLSTPPLSGGAPMILRRDGSVKSSHSSPVRPLQDRIA